MRYSIVDAHSIAAGAGPHPAGSPYDRRVSERLGLTGFEVYQVELPPGAVTVEHDHVADDTEDMYAVVSGTGWLVVDGESVPVAPGAFVAVRQEARRLMRAGADGLVFIAVCSAAGP